MIDPSPSSPQPQIDVSTYPNQVRRIIDEGIRYLEEDDSYYEEDYIGYELCELTHDAKEFVENRDKDNAIAILTAIGEACAENWQQADYHGANAYYIVEQMNFYWTELILSTDLTPSEKREIQSKLEKWQKQWYPNFDMSLTALNQGWDHPSLEKIWRGDFSQPLWEDEPPMYAHQIAEIRFKLLEREKKYTEYLNFAEAEGYTDAYLTLLARINRIDEAMKQAKKKISTADTALALVKALSQQGAIAEALQIGREGLKLQGSCKQSLAMWTSDLAAKLNQPELALAIRIKAFKAHPNLANYKGIATLAGEDWEILKEDLLERLERNNNWLVEDAKIDIWLYESFIDKVIALASYITLDADRKVHKVIDAVITVRPEWVIKEALTRAEDVLENYVDEEIAKLYGDYYQIVEWLSKAKLAYLQLGRENEWLAYEKEVRKNHGSKSELMKLLDEMD